MTKLRLSLLPVLPLIAHHTLWGPQYTLMYPSACRPCLYLSITSWQRARMPFPTQVHTLCMVHQEHSAKEEGATLAP